MQQGVHCAIAALLWGPDRQSGCRTEDSIFEHFPPFCVPLQKTRGARIHICESSTPHTVFSLPPTTTRSLTDRILARTATRQINSWPICAATDHHAPYTWGRKFTARPPPAQLIHHNRNTIPPIRHHHYITPTQHPTTWELRRPASWLEGSHYLLSQRAWRLICITTPILPL